jgi:uncharacterized protein (TIGR02118 family)
MHKLVIMIEPPEDETIFHEFWPKFLHVAEQMPGLVKEATSQVDRVLFGDYHCAFIHEMFFDSYSSIQQAMSSPPGQAAGEVLQKMTGGKMTLLLADHTEDDLENIRSHQHQDPTDET